MPVFKYRTHEEAHRARWLDPGDPRLHARLGWVLELGHRLYPRERPPGVHKFRTLADAAAWRATWKPKPR
jgi:hypothetical protein